jgi:D-alanyl-D-alanine carboxypeptidase/D-alanyl-D-alanine-endopeptidase (penicillin-binding protein 4)
VRPGSKVGDPASVTVVPDTTYLSVQNTCTTADSASAENVSVDRSAGQNIIRVSGTVPLNYHSVKPEESITVDDPALFACHTLTEMLRQDGIDVKGIPMHGQSAGRELVASVSSPPMSQMLRLLNKPSDNLIAECLLKTLGAEADGKGTVESGKLVELSFLKRAGADPSAIGITDGSGLSRRNCISPANLVSVLTYMYRHKNAKVFLDSLPIAGVDGTLRKRMKGTLATGNVRAKTGYLARTSCLSGFVRTKAGENLVFSIMLNNYLCTKDQAIAVQDRILDTLAKERVRFH